MGELLLMFENIVFCTSLEMFAMKTETCSIVVLPCVFSYTPLIYDCVGLFLEEQVIQYYDYNTFKRHMNF